MSAQNQPGLFLECQLICDLEQKNICVAFFNVYLEIQYISQAQVQSLCQKISYDQITSVSFGDKSKGYQNIFVFLKRRDITLRIKTSNSQILKNYFRVRVPQHNFTSSYKQLQTIKSLQNGEIVKCLSVADNKVYAAKIMKKSNSLVLREVEINKLLAQNPHKNFLAMTEYFEDEENFILVFPYLSGGTLYQFMATQKEKNEEVNVKKIIKQILRGLQFLHNLDIIHRDIKMDNIMIEEIEGSNVNIKIIDFGFAVIKNSQDYLNERCGTIGYFAPEIVNDEDYNENCDIYSLAQVFHILLTGNPMYERGIQNQRIITMSKYNLFKIDLYKITCYKTKNLLESMMRNKDERYSAYKCLDHEYFKKSKIFEKVNCLSNLSFKSPFQEFD